MKLELRDHIWSDGEAVHYWGVALRRDLPLILAFHERGDVPDYVRRGDW